MSFEDDLATLGLCIERDASQPLYLQIADQIRQLLDSCRILPGERLPSSRKLAQLLNVSRTSTLNAYEQLISEGLLMTRAASGIFVTNLGGLPNNSDKNQSAFESMTQSRSLCSGGDITLAGFDSGPDVERFPNADWARSLSRVWRNPEPALLRGYHPGGHKGLREMVAQYVKALRGISCRPEQVIITAGSRDALDLLSRLLIQQGDCVALETPCYPPLRTGLINQGAKIVYSEVDEDGMQLPNASIKFAWMTPTRQYPLGISMSPQRKLEWLQFSRQHCCWIIEDDYDSEFQYRKVVAAPLYNMAQSHNQYP